MTLTYKLQKLDGKKITVILVLKRFTYETRHKTHAKEFIMDNEVDQEQF